ncbi:MAG: AbgT family transporter [Pirellulaceae bacterium]|nr:AbgT family transporter [Pirellulaceae bacterium]
MTKPVAEVKTTFQQALDLVERLGNNVPHPAVLFFGLIVLVVLLSLGLSAVGVAVTQEVLVPAASPEPRESDFDSRDYTAQVGSSYDDAPVEQEYDVETRTIAVRSLLSRDGIRFIFTSVVPNFINFGPVGIIMVAMIGVGLAEQSGLIQALIRQIVAIAPRWAMTSIIVTLGVLSSIASDAGYLVLIPLGAAAFHSLGRHPHVGLAAAFAGVAAAFGVNFLVKPIDGILAEMTMDAAHLVDPAYTMDLTSNFYFGIGSSIVLIAVCTLVTDWIVEPRMGKYDGELPPEPTAGPDAASKSAAEGRGLVYAAVALALVVGLLAALSLPAGAPLRNPDTGDLIGNSPFMNSLVFLIMLVFLATGWAYGAGAGTIRRVDDAIHAIVKTFSDLGGLLFLFFVISQFVAYFNYSNIGTVLAVQLANWLQEANLGVGWLLLAFILIGFLLCFPLPNILPKWAIMAPIFVPLFMKLGVDPEIVLAAYRVSDSPPNVINPLLPHFALVVGFAQRYQQSAGVGTIVALMLPYTAATAIAWTLVFFVWWLLGLPFGT